MLVPCVHRSFTIETSGSQSTIGVVHDVRLSSAFVCFSLVVGLPSSGKAALGAGVGSGGDRAAAVTADVMADVRAGVEVPSIVVISLTTCAAISW